MSYPKVCLGDVATFVNGYAFKPGNWSNSGLEIIRIQNLTSSSGERNFFQGELPTKYKVKRGDILISWSATLDIFVWEGEDAWLNQHIFKVVFDKQEVDKIFFFYLIKFVLNDMKRHVHGSTMKHITKDRFDNLQIPLPPLPIQKKIGAILDKADSLRRADKQLLEHYNKLAQSIFYDMFGDPVKNEKGWNRAVLGEICLSIKDGPHVSPKYTVDGIPFISVNNIIKGKIDITNAKYISREDFLEYSRKGKPEPGDVLYTKGGTTGFAKRVDVSFDFMNWVHIAVLKLKRDIVNDVFLESMLNSRYCYVQSQKYTRGIANRDLVLGQMAKIEMILPPLELQKVFAKRLVLIEKQLDVVSSQQEKTKHLFQSLLQKAFKGELVKKP